MTTARETAVAALVAAIDGGTTATVLRDASRPETLPGAGLVVVREGVAEQTDVVLSPLTYHWRQAVTANATSPEPRNRRASLRSKHCSVRSARRLMPTGALAGRWTSSKSQSRHRSPRTPTPEPP